MAKADKMDFTYKITAYYALKQALEFQQAADHIGEMRLVHPEIVNIAFACELYLKAYLIWERKDNIKIKEHRIAELFALLEPAVQDRIRDESNIKNWDHFMKKSSNAFQDWRYYYEHDKVLFGYVGDFYQLADVLEKICEEKISYEEVLVDD